MGDAYLSYRRSKFATRLPADRLFTQSHFWLADQGDGTFRIGFTKFATRMLGEVVEFEFESTPGDMVDAGQVIGWLEGFKAVSDLHAPMAGRFVGANPDLDSLVSEIHESPYDRGWLYSVEGAPPSDAVDSQGYAAYLDQTIDKMMGTDS